MPVFRLTPEIIFPAPQYAEPDGLLAVGGDLSSERLLHAYSLGIFPWYSEGDPIIWWSPDPRLVLEPGAMKISKSLQRVIKRSEYTITADRCFDAVIRACATVKRSGSEGTWIVPEMIEAYCSLHRAGYAHSLEVWSGDELAGGLYGVSLGRAFFGESMFSIRRDASKAALVRLMQAARDWQFDFIDCQVSSPHLKRMGARELPREAFLKRLAEALRHPTRKGPWKLPAP